MGVLETAIMTVVIIIIDVLILKEYLKLEEELEKIKKINLDKQATPALQEMAKEVEEPMVEKQKTVEIQLKSEAERENEKLKIEKELRKDTKKQMHVNDLDEIEDKIEAILQVVKQTNEKLAIS